MRSPELRLLPETFVPHIVPALAFCREFLDPLSALPLLTGKVLRAPFAWWWADPIAALGIVHFIVRESYEALTAEGSWAAVSSIRLPQ